MTLTLVSTLCLSAQAFILAALIALSVHFLTKCDLSYGVALLCTVIALVASVSALAAFAAQGV